MVKGNPETKNYHQKLSMCYDENHGGISMLTQKYLQSIFKYENGNLFWNCSRKGAKKDVPAGTKNTNGYLRVSVDKKLFYVHQLIFLFHHGFMPKFIDHINGNRMDNKIENLRKATCQENNRNQKKRNDNTTGCKGVSKSGKKFRAYITINKKQKWLGVFDTIEDASKAYSLASQEFFGEFARN
jgi:HNH endonuclease